MKDITPAAKANLTKQFNKRHEETKLKKAKAGKIKEEHVKFDPVL